MTNNHCVLNLTRRFRMNRKQALKAISVGACAWVEEGETVRDLTLAESILARNQQTRDREPIANAELPGLRVEMASKYQSGLRKEWELAAQANEFVARSL